MAAAIVVVLSVDTFLTGWLLVSVAHYRKQQVEMQKDASGLMELLQGVDSKLKDLQDGE